LSVYKRGFEKVPYPLGSEEWKSFLNFAKIYYKEAVQIAKESCIDQESYRALLSATVSPLIYLWEQWQLLTSEKQMSYATEEYRKVLEERRRQVEQQMQKVEFGKVEGI
jgi:hypothetical protein